MRRIRIATSQVEVGWSVMVAAASLAALAASAQAAPSGAPVVSSPSEPVAPIVGRWQQLHTCQELVDALNAVDLGALAPGVVGDYFPDQTFDELAAKDDLCSGAKPRRLLRVVGPVRKPGG